MNAVAEFMKNQGGLFRCDRMNANISKKQCDINRPGQPAGPNRMAIKACLSCEGCPGLGETITELKEAPVAQKICSVKGYTKLSQHNKDGMCSAHYSAQKQAVVPSADKQEVVKATGVPIITDASNSAVRGTSPTDAARHCLKEMNAVGEQQCADFIDALDQAWRDKRSQMLLALVGMGYRRSLRLQLDMLDAIEQLGEWS
jgi:hypothetical protein